MDLFSEPPEFQGEGYHNYLCSLTELESSYIRCRSLNVPIELTKPQEFLLEVALTPLLMANALFLAVAEKVIAPICCVCLQKNYLYILCDPDLVALKIFAATEALTTAEENGIKIGTVFTEESCGTNAMALARFNNIT